MRTNIVKIQEKDENFFTKLFNQFHAKHGVISEEEKEEHAFAK